MEWTLTTLVMTPRSTHAVDQEMHGTAAEMEQAAARAGRHLSTQITNYPQGTFLMVWARCADTGDTTEIYTIAAA